MEAVLSSNWVHFAHIYDGSNMMIYRDASRIYNATRAEIGTGNQVPLQVGRWRNDTNAYFQGVIDDFRVYNDALTETEIQTILIGQDTFTETQLMQFVIDATDNPMNFSVSGLPEGLTLDARTGQVTGLAQEVGIFDLNLTASNQAGISAKTIQLIVNKTPPTLTSSSPKNLSSTTARFAGRMISDGVIPQA